jgi:hypothetical protein
MSDQLGVGMAALIMEQYFHASDAVDVDVAVADASLGLTLEQATTPDYIFGNPSNSVMFVVECKGTHGSRSSVVDQLRRGTEQLPSLKFTDGRPPPQGLIIGTQLSPSGVKVYVVDPPGDDDTEVEPRERRDRRTLVIPDSNAFERASRAAAQAKLLAFAGEEQASASRLRGVWPEWVETAPRERGRAPFVRENRFGVFRGRLDRLILADGVQVEVFQGLERNLLEAYTGDDRDAVATGVIGLDRRRREVSSETPSGLGVESTLDSNSATVRSVALDGTIFELNLMRT